MTTKSRRPPAMSSEVKQYDAFDGYGTPLHGKFVRHDDYAALEAELAALKAPAVAGDELPEGWALVEKPTCFVLMNGREVIATLAGPDAESNAAMIAQALTRPAQTEQQPCGYQYQAPDGNWFPIAKSMLAEAEEHGHKVRAIYAAPDVQGMVSVPRELAVQLRAYTLAWAAEYEYRHRMRGFHHEHVCALEQLDAALAAHDKLA